MAGRSEQNTADFFPFFCKYGDAMDYLQEKYKNDGFATWVKILRALSMKSYHFLDLRNKKSLMNLASKCFISEEKLLEIISILVEFEEFDREIWEKYTTIWNQKFVDSLGPLYERRKNNCLTKAQLLEFLGNNVDINSINDYINTQSKVKKSKVKESRVEITPEGEQKKDSIGMYFRIGKEIFKYQPSKYVLEQMPSFREIFCMQRLSQEEEKQKQQLAEVCAEFDKQYACQTFSNENHIQNAFKKIHENLNNGNSKNTKALRQPSGKGYNESL